jgi:hypothetical protein
MGSLKVREAKHTDILAIAECAERLIGESYYAGIDIDMPMSKQLALRMISEKLSFVQVIVSEPTGDYDTSYCHGFMLGAVQQLWFSRARYATDLLTLVDKTAEGYGAIMIRRFIAWAKKQPKVVDITMGVGSAMGDSDRVGELYEGLGLARLGGIYAARIDLEEQQASA